MNNSMRMYKIMKNKATFLFIVLLLSPSLLYAWEGKVVSVTDGDTIKVLSSGIQVKVRLAAIDCPEKGQPWGKKAKQFTSHMVLHKTVVVLPEGEDRLRQDNRMGIHRRNQSQYSSDSLSTALEMEARVMKKGLWSEPNPVPPWEWRKRNKSGKTKFEFSGEISTTIEH